MTPKFMLPALILLSGILGGSAEQPPEPQWYRIVTEAGAFIGYSSQETLKRVDGRDIVEAHVIDAGEEHGPLVLTPWNNTAKDTNISRRSVRREDAKGKTTSISAESSVGKDWRRDNVRIVGSRAKIVHETPSESRTLQISLPPAVRFDFGDELLSTVISSSMQPVEFENFNLSSLSVERVRIEPIPSQAPDHRTLVRKSYQGENLIEAEWISLDASGRISRIVQPMFGTRIVVEATDRAEALRRHSVYRPLPNVMTKSPYRISQQACEAIFAIVSTTRKASVLRFRKRPSRKSPKNRTL